MSNKTKNTKSTADNLSEVAMQAGLILMAAAATVGMVELPEHPNSKVALTAQPVFVNAGENTTDVNPIRREREETSPHFISYSVTQRTAGRTGKA